MTTVSTPRSTIAASKACRSGASGVVSELGATTPLMRVATVPMSPTDRPAANKAASTMYAVVVLPEVPVIPMSANAALGWWKTRALRTPSTLRGSGWIRTATADRRRPACSAMRSAPAGSVSTAVAPRRIASSA